MLSKVRVSVNAFLELDGTTLFDGTILSDGTTLE